MIYCIGSRDHKVCKIGYTKGLKSRIEAIQTGCPYHLTCFSTLPGGRDVEAAFHKRFHSLRTRGEWFVLTEEIAAAFEFELNPVLYLWSVVLIYSECNPEFQLYHNEVTTVFAVSEEDALIQAKSKMNIQGRLLRSWCKMVPAADIETAYEINKGLPVTKEPERHELLYPERKPAITPVEVRVLRSICQHHLGSSQIAQINTATPGEKRTEVRRICLLHGTEIPSETEFAWKIRGSKINVMEVEYLEEAA